MNQNTLQKRRRARRLTREKKRKARRKKKMRRMKKTILIMMVMTRTSIFCSLIITFVCLFFLELYNAHFYKDLFMII